MLPLVTIGMALMDAFSSRIMEPSLNVLGIPNSLSLARMAAEA